LQYLTGSSNQPSRECEDALDFNWQEIPDHRPAATRTTFCFAHHCIESNFQPEFCFFSQAIISHHMSIILPLMHGLK